MTTIVLDNEAVQALLDPTAPKHRVVMAHLAAIVVRRRRGDGATAIVPTSVRVEAGWDRTKAGTASVNRLRIADHSLDGRAANTAADIVIRESIGVADAHVGVVASTLADRVVVLTSDPDDMIRASSPTRITAVRI